jgi:hypothetical protein
VDLQLSKGKQIIAEGQSEVNAPFAWERLNFYHTRNENDAEGRTYAGIQIVDDPGRWIVYTGFGIIITGTVLWLYQRMSRFGMVQGKQSTAKAVNR